MPCELRWLASASTTAFHAAAAIDRGLTLVEVRMADALSDPVAELQRLLSSEGLPRDAFWRHVVPLSTDIGSNRELADVTLRKIVPVAKRSSQLVAALAAAFTDLERATDQLFPELVDELELRSKPLRQQWEACGPGLLVLIGQRTDEQLIVPGAAVILVHPVLGGGGQAHLDYNSVNIEAVLADPHQQLPEVLRLAWMLSQLNNDLPMHSEMIHGQALPVVSELAMLPAVLTAAQELGMARMDQASIQLAIEAWSCRIPGDVDLADLVTNWWDTFCTSRPSWNVALTALAQMIEEPLASRQRQ